MEKYLTTNTTDLVETLGFLKKNTNDIRHRFY